LHWRFPRSGPFGCESGKRVQNFRLDHQIVVHRCFAEADEAIANQWSKEIGTSGIWTLGDLIGTGESSSLNVTSGDGRRGACKPAFAADGTPRAAHEKIAAD
jgi:hypothetical protein